MHIDHPQLDTAADRARYLTRLIVSGQKIKAIHFVRESEHVALVQAKQMVEALEAELRQLPDGHPDKPPKRGGLPRFLLPFLVLDAVVVIAVVAWFVLGGEG